MGCGCKRTFSGGRKQTKIRNRKTRKQTKRNNKRNYKKRSYRNRKMRRMSGGSTGLVDPVTSGLHDATTKLMSTPFIPSNAHIQPAGEPYKDDRNPYYV